MIGLVARMVLAGAVGAGVATAMEPAMEPAPLPSTAVRLDAERERFRAETAAAEARAAEVRRAASGFERRRQEALRALDAEAAALAARERDADATIAALREGVRERDAEIEHVLRAGGLWVSFTDDIAPLLRARCVACHTPREPGGGHVLTRYAALLADGGAGAAVVPGDVDSPLVRVVADGSMPKDGHPLSPADVERIRRWVALGARLDAGADPEAALVRIMPRPMQPAAPVAYPAAPPVAALAFHPDGTRLASSGYHEVLVWNVADGRLVRRIGNVAERVHGLAFHPDGRRLAVAAGTPGSLGEAKVFDVDSGALVADLDAADDSALAVAFAPDGGRLASAGADPTVRLYEGPALRAAAARGDHADWVQGAAFSADGRLLATASRDKTAKVTDVVSGRLIATFSGHGQGVNAVGFLGATLVATGGADGRARIWEATSGKEVRAIDGFAGPVTALAAIGTAAIVAGDRSGSAQVINADDGRQVRAFTTGGGPVTALAVSADGRMVAIGALDGTIAIETLGADTPARRWLGAVTAAP